MSEPIKPSFSFPASPELIESLKNCQLEPDPVQLVMIDENDNIWTVQGKIVDILPDPKHSVSIDAKNHSYTIHFSYVEKPHDDLKIRLSGADPVANKTPYTKGEFWVMVAIAWAALMVVGLAIYKIFIRLQEMAHLD